MGNTDEDALAISGYKIKMKILRRNIYMNGHYRNIHILMECHNHDAENTMICLNH